MSELTAKEIASKLDKTAQEINAALCEIGFIKKLGKGYEICELGKENGGIQAKYMGNDFVKWDEKILENKIFLGILNPNQDENESEVEKNFRQKYKAEFRTKADISCEVGQNLLLLIICMASSFALLMRENCLLKKIFIVIFIYQKLRLILSSGV